MDNIDVRSYIKDNFKDSDINEIRSSIETSIEDKDDITLPGLGVLFEIFWNNIDENEKNKVLGIIKDNL